MSEDLKTHIEIINSAEEEAEEKADISSVEDIETFRQYFLNKQRFFFPAVEKRITHYSNDYIDRNLYQLSEVPYHSNFLTKIKKLTNTYSFDNLREAVKGTINIEEKLGSRLPNNYIAQKTIGLISDFQYIAKKTEVDLNDSGVSFLYNPESFSLNAILRTLCGEILGRNQSSINDDTAVSYKLLQRVYRFGKVLPQYLPYEKIASELRKARVITKSTNYYFGYESSFNKVSINIHQLLFNMKKELENRNPLSFLSVTNSSFPIVSINVKKSYITRGLYFPELKSGISHDTVYPDNLIDTTLPSRLMFYSTLDSYDVSYDMIPDTSLDDSEWLSQFDILYNQAQIPNATFLLLTLFVPQVITSYRYLRYMQYKVNNSPLRHAIKILMPQNYYAHEVNPEYIFKPFTREEKVKVAKKSLHLSNMSGILEPLTHVPITIVVANQGAGIIAFSYIQEIMTCLENVDRLYLESYLTA